MFKVVPAETIIADGILIYDYITVEVIEIILVLLQLGVVVFDRILRLFGRCVNISHRAHHGVANRFEFFVFLNWNLIRHDVGVGTDGFAFISVPRIVKLGELRIVAEDFYNFIYESFRFFIKISVHLFALVLLKSFGEHLHFHNEFGSNSVVAVFNFGDHSCDGAFIFSLQIISDLGLLFIDGGQLLAKNIRGEGLLEIVDSFS